MKLKNKQLRIHGKEVFGVNLDCHTGCAHYHSALDIIAIKFSCCKRYYACYFCHCTAESHPAEQWHPSAFGEKAILCGLCGKELTIHQYLSCNTHCLYCKANFNVRCKLHWTLYFGAMEASILMPCRIKGLEKFRA